MGMQTLDDEWQLLLDTLHHAGDLCYKIPWHPAKPPQVGQSMVTCRSHHGSSEHDGGLTVIILQPASPEWEAVTPQDAQDGGSGRQPPQQDERVMVIVFVQ